MTVHGNWGFLIVVAAAVLGLISVAMGAHLYRWEAITWYSVAIAVALTGYFYSREVE